MYWLGPSDPADQPTSGAKWRSHEDLDPAGLAERLFAVAAIAMLAALVLLIALNGWPPAATDPLQALTATTP